MSRPQDESTRSGAQQQSAPFVIHEGSGVTLTPSGDKNRPIAFAPPSHPGELGRLGKYRIQKELGRGGMGAVFLAFDERLERNVALKVMLASEADATSRERFLREARAAAKINSDHVVAIYEADEIDDIPYISQQYLLGQPLDRLVEKYGTPTIQQIVRIAHETALGLDAAHHLGLVHRDIKPANLWVEAQNGRVKILDFGLARQQQSNIQLTTSGMVVGTPAFMSPEQGRGSVVDGRSDLFSLGGVLYWLCTGRLPFQGETTMALLMAIGIDDPKPVREQNSNVPEPLENLILQLLAKDPAKRPFSARDVAEELAAIFDTLATPGLQQEQDTKPLTDMVGAGPLTAEHAMNQRVASPPVEKRPFPKLLVGSLAVAVFGLVALGAILLSGNTNKNPDTAAKPEPAPTPKDPPEKTPPPSAKSADRAAAEYVFSVGGTVRVNGEERDIKVLAELPKGDIRLDWVSLDGSKHVTAEGLTHLKDCKHLVNLSMNRANVTDAGLAHLKDCTSLRHLSLHANSTVGDAGMLHLKNLKNLTHLVLNNTSVTSVGMANFSECKSLIWLDLGSTGVNDAGMTYFKDCKQLEHLTVLNTQVTDEGLENFRGCKMIKQLALGGHLVSDRGLAIFNDCKDLEDVYAFNTQISDEGLKQLQDKRKLKRVTVTKTNVTAEGARELAMALPNCSITYTGGKIEPKQ